MGGTFQCRVDCNTVVKSFKTELYIRSLESTTYSV